MFVLGEALVLGGKAHARSGTCTRKSRTVHAGMDRQVTVPGWEVKPAYILWPATPRMTPERHEVRQAEDTMQAGIFGGVGFPSPALFLLLFTISRCSLYLIVFN